MRWFVLLLALGFAGCEQTNTGDDYQAGRQDGCAEVGGSWDVEMDECVLTPPPEPQNWIMVQDAQTVTFAFDPIMDDACPADTFWSGTMTMTGVDEETLLFTGRPYRHAYTQSTAVFIAGFDETFSQATSGNPNAVLNWEDADTSKDKQVVIELGTPNFDTSSQMLTYSVCGLKLDDPGTLEPLPDGEQLQPAEAPAALGRFSLFIDTAQSGTPSCGTTLETTDCYLMGFCGSEGYILGSCAQSTAADAEALDPEGNCLTSYKKGAKRSLLVQSNTNAPLELVMQWVSYGCQ